MGSQYTDKTECLATLAEKQNAIEKQIEALHSERAILIEQYKSQYLKQKCQPLSIQKLVKSLDKTIMESSNT